MSPLHLRQRARAFFRYCSAASQLQLAPPLTTHIPPHLRHAPRQHEVQRGPTTQTQLGTVSLHGRTVAANPTVENNPLREPTPWNRNANVNSPRVSGISQLRHQRNDKGVGYALLLGSDEPFPGCFHQDGLVCETPVGDMRYCRDPAAVRQRRQLKQLTAAFLFQDFVDCSCFKLRAPRRKAPGPAS